MCTHSAVIFAVIVRRCGRLIHSLLVRPTTSDNWKISPRYLELMAMSYVAFRMIVSVKSQARISLRDIIRSHEWLRTINTTSRRDPEETRRVYGFLMNYRSIKSIRILQSTDGKFPMKEYLKHEETMWYGSTPSAEKGFQKIRKI